MEPLASAAAVAGTEAAVSELRRLEGVDYADCRVVEEEREELRVRGAEIERLDRRRSAGLGVRVLWRGAWGFAARPGWGEADGVLAARAAVEVAQASARLQREKVRLTEEDPAAGAWATPVA